MQVLQNFNERSWAAAVVLCLLCACSKNDTPPQGNVSKFNVSGILLPETIETAPGATVTLQVAASHGPQSTDKVVLAGLDTFVLPITACSDKSFSFTMAEDAYSGDFTFSIRRSSQDKKVGKTHLVIDNGPAIDPDGATVYGRVSAKGKGVKGVVVSDGIEVTATDEAGIYRLNSAKKHGYVFISAPSGYEPFTDGILPIIHKQLTKSADAPEQVNFDLIPVEGQDNCTVLMMGDMHLANRTKDRQQFSEFVKDVNDFVSTATGKVYGVTLGDMTWDLYWIVNNYGYQEYLKDANAIKGLTIYHTIGNHDHSMYYAGDFDTVKEYKKLIAPTYYSFNIGKVHYVVLDDVKCTNSEKTTDSKGNACYVRAYDASLTTEQLNWLEKDLSYVDKSTPLVITMHIQFHNEDGTQRFTSSKLVNLMKQYPKVQLYTAHTHRTYHVDRFDADHFMEHNGGAVCGTWWWSGNETPGVHIGQDGSPGGYTVLKVKGTDFDWQYKATGSDVNYQFRTYDRNNILINAKTYVPSGNATYQSKFSDYTGRWATENKNNEVYVNVWNWDPAWKVEITENGTPLTVKRVTECDPLHLIAYTAKRLNNNAEAGFATEPNRHLFYATASSASSTLEIKVTDRFGHVYTETMTRPKKFNTDIYIK